MCQNAAEKDTLVFLWAAVLFRSWHLSGAWLYEGKIRVKKSERDLYYAVKTIKAVGEDALPMLVQKEKITKKKKKNPSK